MSTAPPVSPPVSWSAFPACILDDDVIGLDITVYRRGFESFVIRNANVADLTELASELLRARCNPDANHILKPFARIQGRLSPSIPEQWETER